MNGEIISCDSMQIYKDMDIGTAKVTEEEKQGIKHYLVDFVLPSERYTVSNFKKDCEDAIEEILAKGKTPIVVGGTGLYVNSLIYGIEYQDMEFDENYRNELMKKAETEEGLKELYEEATKIDSQAMQIISKNDKKRIVRVLEIYNATGKTKTEQEELSRAKGVKYDFEVYAISMDRDKLYDRINRRVDLMIEKGLIEEVENLLEKYSEFPTAMQGLGYKEVVEFLDGKLTKEEMIEKIKQESRHYAKRQLTWFRKNKEIIWLDAENDMQDNINVILKGRNCFE
jgi:tRNA dimethylallyltransferase